MNSAFTYTEVHNVVPFMSNHRRYNIHNEAVQTWTHSPDHIFVNRIDIQVMIQPVGFDELAHMPQGESSEQIRARVIAARKIQQERFQGYARVHCNAQMTSFLMRQYCVIKDEDIDLLRNAMERYQLSARAYDRILRVSRTIADLDASPDIERRHLIEALTYRNLDRSTWGE